jgi:RNA polymerase sigma factor (sigma-70 family)
MSSTGQDINGQKLSSVTPSFRGDSFEGLSSKQRLDVFRARQSELRETNIHYVGNEAEFRARDSWEKIVESPEPPSGSRAKSSTFESDAEHLQYVFKHPLLTRDQEHYLFRKMNYLKFVANEVRKTLSVKKVEPSKVARVDELLAQANQIRDVIVERNLRLVLSIGLTFFPRQPDKCVSIGVTSVMESLEKFDYQRGNKFSTFVTQPIRWGFLKHRQTETRPREAFHSRALSLDEYELPDIPETDSVARVKDRQREQRSVIERHLNLLDFRSRQIVEKRYGLNGEERQTLKKIGDAFGITKERVRQLEADALQKLFGLISINEAFPD